MTTSKKGITKKTTARTPQEQMQELRRNLAGQLPEGKLRRMVELVNDIFEPNNDQKTRALALTELTKMLEEESASGERIFINYIVTLVSFIHTCDTRDELRDMMNKIKLCRKTTRRKRDRKPVAAKQGKKEEAR